MQEHFKPGYKNAELSLDFEDLHYEEAVDKMADKAISRNLELYDDRVADNFHFDNKTIDVGYCGFSQLSIVDTSLEITY